MQVLPAAGLVTQVGIAGANVVKVRGPDQELKSESEHFPLT